MILKRNSIGGLSLIETAIVLTIAGLLMGAFLRGYYIVEQRQRIETTKTRLEDLRTALELYVAINDRLPCPASPLKKTDDGKDIDICSPDAKSPPEGAIALALQTRFEKDNSNEAWLGVIPVKEMRLDPEEARDGWGNQFSYAVSRRLTLPHGMHGNPTPQGSLSVLDPEDHNVLDKADSGRWVILSHGPSGFGAWSPEGGRKPCPPGTLDARNCEDNGVFYTAPFSTAPGELFYDQFLIFDDLSSGGNLVDRIAKCNLKMRFFYPASPNADDEGCVYESSIWHGACLVSSVSMNSGPFRPFLTQAESPPAIAQGNSCGCSPGYTVQEIGTWDNAALAQQKFPPPKPPATTVVTTALFTCF